MFQGIKPIPDETKYYEVFIRDIVGKFLGYLVIQRGIKANLNQILDLTGMPSPKIKREVKRLTGMVATLNRFISKSTDKCLPFFKCVKKNTGNDFKWDDACEKAFQQLKEYLASPSMLPKPVEGEPIYLYVDVSPTAFSGVLV